MGDVACSAASLKAGRFAQVNRFCLAAVPVIGFVHGAIERHRVDVRELHSEYLQPESQHHFLLKVLDCCTAGFVIMAVVCGPGLAWLLLT